MDELLWFIEPVECVGIDPCMDSGPGRLPLDSLLGIDGFEKCEGREAILPAGMMACGAHCEAKNGCDKFEEPVHCDAGFESIGCCDICH
jgi:hypothetical protein